MKRLFIATMLAVIVLSPLAGAALYLKQSTAKLVKIGPFVDSTDGVTVETGLTINQANVELSKDGGTWAQKGEATACTHKNDGWYDCNLSTTDTNTLGRLILEVNVAGSAPVWHEFMVVTANWYDSMFSTDKIQVDVIEWSLAPMDPCTMFDSAYLITASDIPTPEEIRLEIDTNSTEVNYIALNMATSAEVGAISTTIGTAGAGLTALPELVMEDANAPKTLGYTSALATNLGTTNTTVSTNLDAAVSTRATPAQVTTALETTVEPNLTLVMGYALAAQVAAEKLDTEAEFADVGSTLVDNIVSAMDANGLLAGLTSARAGYLDNLNVGGLVASEANETLILAEIADLDANMPSPALTTTVASGSSKSVFTLTAGKAAVNAYLYQLITITDATDGTIETRVIVGYTAGRQVMTDRPFSFTPEAADVARVEKVVFKPTKAP